MTAEELEARADQLEGLFPKPLRRSHTELNIDVKFCGRYTPGFIRDGVVMSLLH